MQFLIVMVLLLVVMYVLMIRPQRQRQQAHQTTVDRAGVGDDILTTGGIYGTITHAEDDDIVVEIADGLSVHMTRRGIAAVLPPEEEEEEEEHEEETSETLRRRALDEADAELDVATVRSRDEAVRDGADSDPATADRR